MFPFMIGYVRQKKVARLLDGIDEVCVEVRQAEVAEIGNVHSSVPSNVGG